MGCWYSRAMIGSDGDVTKEKILLNRSFVSTLLTLKSLYYYYPEGSNFITLYGMALVMVYINTSVLHIFCCW